MKKVSYSFDSAKTQFIMFISRNIAINALHYIKTSIQPFSDKITMQERAEIESLLEMVKEEGGDFYILSYYEQEFFESLYNALASIYNERIGLK